MAVVHCPYCEHSREVKGAKTGRYHVKCPRCERMFLLAVRADPGREPFVATSRSELDAGATSLVPSSRETVAAPALAATEPGTAAPDETLADDGRAPEPFEQTGAWASTPTGAIGETVGAPNGHESGHSARRVSEGAALVDVEGEGRPATLGGYTILDELGRGGMGAVFLARQQSLGRNVALKVMRPEWAGDPSFLARFTREAYAAAQLVHHNIVQIYDFGEDQGTSFFSMEFVEGQTLARLIATQKRVDVELAVGYVLQAARGLKAAHDQSMVHRDVKPENLLLNRHGIVKVADLGLVKSPELAEELDRREAAGLAPLGLADASLDAALTRANVAMGTPAFMAPEQARDAAGVDARADIYSLGCTLYDLVTGRPPSRGRRRWSSSPSTRPSRSSPPTWSPSASPKALSGIVLKMVAKRPEDRYSDLGEVIEALEEFLGVRTTGPFTPREEHAELLEESASSG